MGAPLLRMTSHFCGKRTPPAAGSLVLSRLEGGESDIQAMAPSLKFVVEGEEIYQIDGRAYRLGPGDFMLVEAGSQLHVRTPRGLQTRGMCVYLPQASLEPAEAAEIGARAILGSPLDPLATVLRRHAAAFDGANAVPPDAVAALEHAALRFITRFSETANRLGATKRSTRIETLQRLERARSFLHECEGRLVGLDEVARHAALSRFHLVRTFAEVYGCSPLAYHRRLRLESAVARLRKGDLTATQIAEQLGYGSLSAFTRACRNQFGEPPSVLAGPVA